MVYSVDINSINVCNKHTIIFQMETYYRKLMYPCTELQSKAYVGFILKLIVRWLQQIKALLHPDEEANDFFGNLIESKELPIKFPLKFHWPRWNVPISEMIPDKINDINFRLDMRVIRYSVSPLIQAAGTGGVVDMESLGSMRKREARVLSRQLTISITQTILERLKIFINTSCYKAQRHVPNICYHTIHKSNINY